MLDVTIAYINHEARAIRLTQLQSGGAQ
jgi:hypothetical protein